MSSSTDPTTRVVGLLADPGLPADVAEDLAETLPSELSRDVDASVDWRVEAASQELTLDEDGRLPVVAIGQEQMARQGWDLVVLMTDLPRRAGTRPIVSDFGSAEGIALVSLPALGGVGVGHQARKVVLHLLTDHLVDRGGNGTRREDHEHGDLRVGGPVEHIPSGDQGIDAHLALSGARGRLRLLAGMVRTNRPWRLVPSLSPAIAGAAAGAAFGIFYSNIWQLAEVLGGLRLTLVAVIAVLGMIAWLIVDNGLWVRSSEREMREEAVMYNAATLGTVSVGVLSMYVLLYVITVAAAAVVIPPGYLGSVLHRPVGPADFLTIAWLATSMGIVAGALGSGLAGEDAVRRAAYSKREEERRARFSENG
jgi:hypothetical protein